MLPEMDLLHRLAMLAAAAALVVQMLRWGRDSGGLQQLASRMGLGSPTVRPTGWWVALLAGALSVFLPAAVSVAAGWAGWSTAPWDPSAGPLAATLGAKALLVVSEEILFRSALITLLLGFVSPGRAVVVSAALFALSHGGRGPFDLLILFADGIGFGCAFVWTRRIWLPAAWHFSKNLAVWLLGGGTLQWAAGPWVYTQLQDGLWPGFAGRAGLADLLLTGVVVAAAVAAIRSLSAPRSAAGQAGGVAG